MSADIIRGNNSAIGLQIALPLLVPYSGAANLIVASTADNPAKFTTQYPHGFSTGQKVLILGENTNISILGNHTVTIVDSTNGTLNVAGWEASTEKPTIHNTLDMSAITPVLKLKRFPGGPVLTDANDVAITPTFTWDDRTIFSLTWKLTETDTANLEKGQIILSVSWTDSQGQDWTIDITYLVGNA